MRAEGVWSFGVGDGREERGEGEMACFFFLVVWLEGLCRRGVMCVATGDELVDGKLEVGSTCQNTQ